MASGASAVQESDGALPAARGRNYHFAGTIYRMALNIKDPEVDRLAAELATRLHTNKTDAIRHALRAQLALLESRAGDRQAQLLDVMRTEIWPLLSDRSPITKREREEILGYDPETGV
jgi:antitoxin VapB